MAEKIFLIIFFLFMILISFVYMINLLKNSEYRISRKELFYFIFIVILHAKYKKRIKPNKAGKKRENPEKLRYIAEYSVG